MKNFNLIFAVFATLMLVFISCSKEDNLLVEENLMSESTLKSTTTIPTEGLVAYYPLDGNGYDLSVSGNDASVILATSSKNRFKQSGKCYQFNGIDEYIEIPDNDQISIATTGEMSVSVWMRPDVIDFPITEGTGDYVHWIGKGGNSKHEWTFRMYNNDSYRPNRISCYVFNLNGGLGAGSYVQEIVKRRTWIHFVAIYNYPNDEIRWYKNGVLKDVDTFSGYNINPENGVAPLRFGTQDFNSYFKGAIDDVRIYNRVLTESEISQLYNEVN